MKPPLPDESQYVLAHVQAVLDGRLSASELGEDEQRLFVDLLGQRNRNRPEATVFSAKLLQEPGNVGYDGEGNLVRTLGKGKVQRVSSSDEA